MKYTPELADSIAALVADGMSPSRSGVLLDVSKESVSEWIRTKPDFAAMIEKSRALYVQKLVKRVEAAGERDWKANMALLERREPEEFGRVATLKAEVTDKREARDAAIDAFANDPMYEAFLRDEARIAFARGARPKPESEPE